jgi:hypothetical protein
MSSNAVVDVGTGQVNSSNEAPEIDWDNLEILPFTEEQIGSARPLMDEDAMYEFLGLREEDERAEKEKPAAEREDEVLDDIELEGAALLVNNVIPG